MPGQDLTKSKPTLFEQCPKRLWLSVHWPDLIEIDEATMTRLDTGERPMQANQLDVRFQAIRDMGAAADIRALRDSCISQRKAAAMKRLARLFVE